MLVFFYIILYGIILLVFYFLVIGRLKVLSRGHVENTGAQALEKGYRVARRRIIVALTVLFVLSSLVILTFMDDELLYQRGLYNNQEALDNNGF